MNKSKSGGFALGQSIAYRLERAGHVIKNMLGIERKPALLLGGTFKYQIVAKDGTVKSEGEFSNGVTNEGLDRILNTMFDGKTQIAAGGWFLGLISSVSFTALAATDTYDGIDAANGWKEASGTNAPNYTGDRKAWDPAASTARSSTNTTTVDFAITGSGTVKGIFLASFETKADSTAAANSVLWSTGLFPGGDQAVVASDTLKITYTVNAAAA